MSTRRLFLQLGAAVGTGAAIRWQLDPTSGLLFSASRAIASVTAKQTPLPGASIQQFVTPLPTFAGRRVASASFTAGMREFQQKVLPDGMYGPLTRPFNNGTFLWGYEVDSRPLAWPASTIVAQRGTTTTVKWQNDIPLPARSGLHKYLTLDQTVHWADPLHEMGSFEPFSGPAPMVVHLHGAEVSSLYDGAAEGWFTPNGLHGKGYATLRPTDANAAFYQYPNTQQATTLWFHDHALGSTRVNILSGLAGMYLIRDQFDTGLSDNPLRLPAGGQEIELMIQDRQFDTNLQLLFPDGSEPDALVLNGGPPNPKIHPFWNPEFFGDVNVVNGRSWPFLDVEPRRYRFRIVDAANARMYRMRLVDASTTPPRPGPAIWQIGSDGGLFDRPVKLADGPNTLPLFLATGERADVIIDFAGQNGQTFTLTNDAEAPFPSGDPPDAPTAGRIMQFKVRLPLSSRDDTYNPASGAPLRGGHDQEPVIVRLANPTSGTLAAGVRPSVKRQLVLVEVEGDGGPIEVLLNNTRWDGTRADTGRAIPDSRPDQFGQGNFLTELPRVGSTEVWEIANLTVDAHPIHLHLIQFQVINRQAFIVPDPTTGETAYRAHYDQQFPGGRFSGQLADLSWGPVTYPPGVFIPAFGPPRDYDNTNRDDAVGGNPSFTPWLTGPTMPPDPAESGWKDTLKMLPATLTRIVVRWAPQATAVDGVRSGQNLYAFDPTFGPGYAWHCHILDHEDNQMMRPYIPTT